MKIESCKFNPQFHSNKSKNTPQIHSATVNWDSDLNNNPLCLYNKISFSGINKDKQVDNKHFVNNYKSCLIGGAVGDALGWPVEFMRLRKIKEKYGENGITDLIKRNGKVEITDDTQMTIFTADGLLKSVLGSLDEESVPDMKTVYNSYQDWLTTQGSGHSKGDKGWIFKINDLYERRAPGNTCLSSLESEVPGTVDDPINDSSGCGGVMRVAPVGLMYWKNPELAFDVGAKCAALTHGSPMGYLPAGVHSAIVANIIKGETLKNAVDKSIDILASKKDSQELVALMKKARSLAKTSLAPEKAIESLGLGWDGHEAIAIATYCVLKESKSFEKALIMAVNHNGDSDSTGSIVGNILGAHLGIDKIPKKWLKEVELSKELAQIAQDLHSPLEIENAEKKYPYKSLS